MSRTSLEAELPLQKSVQSRVIFAGEGSIDWTTNQLDFPADAEQSYSGLTTL